MDADGCPRQPVLPRRYGYFFASGLGLADDDDVISQKVTSGVMGWWLSVHYFVVVVTAMLPVSKDGISDDDAMVVSIAALTGLLLTNLSMWHYTATGKVHIHSHCISVVALLFSSTLTILLHGDIPVHLLSFLSPATSLCLGHRETTTAVLATCAMFTNIVGAALVTNPKLISGRDGDHWTQVAVVIGHAYCISVGVFGSLAFMWYFMQRRTDIRPPSYVAEHMMHEEKPPAKDTDTTNEQIAEEEEEAGMCCWAISLRRQAGILSSIIFIGTGISCTLLLDGMHETNRADKTEIINHHAHMMSELRAEELDLRLAAMQRFLKAPRRQMPYPGQSYLVWNYSIAEEKELSAVWVSEDVVDVTGMGAECCGEENVIVMSSRWVQYVSPVECSELESQAGYVYVHQEANETQPQGYEPVRNNSAIVIVCQVNGFMKGVASSINLLTEDPSKVVHDPNRTYKGCQSADDVVTCHAPTASGLSIVEQDDLPDRASGIFRFVIMWLIVIVGAAASIIVVTASLRPINRFAIAAHIFASGEKPLEQMKLPSNCFKELMYLKWSFYRLANAVLEARHLVHPGALDLASLQQENEMISEGGVCAGAGVGVGIEKQAEKEVEEVDDREVTEPTVEDDVGNASSSSFVWLKNIMKKKEGGGSVPSTPRSPRKAAVLNLLQATNSGELNGHGQDSKPADGDVPNTSNVKKAVRFAAETKVQHLSPRHVLQSVDAAVLAMNVSRFHVHLRNMKPNAAVDLFSEVFTIAVWAVQECGGTTINISGDRMLALWRYDKTDKACEAALKIQQQLSSLPHRQPISVRIGISGGRVTWGNFSLNPTEGRGMSVVNMLGIPVNKAAHLERFNKSVGTSTLVDGWVYERLQAYRPSSLVCRPVEMIYYKRLTSRKDTPPTPVFELLAATRFPTDPTVLEYMPDAAGGELHLAAFHATLQEDWERAEELLLQENIPVNIHIARLIKIVKTRRPPVEIED